MNRAMTVRVAFVVEEVNAVCPRYVPHMPQILPTKYNQSATNRNNRIDRMIPGNSDWAHVNARPKTDVFDARTVILAITFCLTRSFCFRVKTAFGVAAFNWVAIWFVDNCFFIILVTVSYLRRPQMTGYGEQEQ